jgi:membrane protein implicated in regulation of membrane protease activity
VVLVLAVLAGVAGGWLIFLFIARVLLKDEHELTAEETAIVGAVGSVSAPIRAGRTGEVLYKQLGAVVSVPARSEDGMGLARQEEVYVVRYEKGIAYVRRFDDIANGMDHTTTASS